MDCKDEQLPKTSCIAFASGCLRAEVDLARLHRYLQVNGWQVVPEADGADLVIVGTCGVTAKYEEYSLRLLRQLSRRMRPDGRLVVVGCLAGMAGQKLQRVRSCIVIASKDLDRMDGLIGATKPLREVREVNRHGPHIREAFDAFLPQERRRAALPTIRRLAQMHWSAEHLKKRLRSWWHGHRMAPALEQAFCIRVCRGCLSECSYCAIRFGAGALRSKPAEQVLAEFREGLAGGNKLFKLLGEDVSAYGLDSGSNIAELLGLMCAEEGDYKLHLTDMNPRWVSRHLRALEDVLSAHPGRFQEILIPLQSGSDKILSAMNRGHTTVQAVDAIRALRLAAPKVRISTHVLVGFPGETQRDFDETIALVRSLRFDHVGVYYYTDRPGAAASLLTPKVPERAKFARTCRLLLRCRHCGVGA